MEATKETYPAYTVIISNLLNVLLYSAGALVLFQFGTYYLIPYFIYILLLEIRLLKLGCTKCYYFGKVCAFGKGKISSFFFSKDESVKFCDRPISKLDFFFDSLTALVPLIAGVIMMFTDFSMYILILCLFIVILTTAGNACVRGQLACKHCRQKELGCPAEQAFGGK